MIACISLFVLLVGQVLSLQSATPTLVPFGGITASNPSQSFGQVVTGISDITSFTFSIASISGPGGDTANASIASWGSGGRGATIGSTQVTLPTTSAGYTSVTATLNRINLDPTAFYVIAITWLSRSKYEPSTAFTSDGSIGGFVEATGDTWRSGYTKDCVFSLAFKSIMSVDPKMNFAQSHESTGWQCNVNTTFRELQVNWQTLKVNTGYFGGAVSTVRYGPSSCASTYAPYGTAAACWDAQYQLAWSYAYIDLTGTRYKVDDTWNVGVGYLADGYARFLNGGQTVSIAGSGDCGMTYVKDQTNECNGGFHLHIARL